MSDYVKSSEIPDESQFHNDRRDWRHSLALDSQLRLEAVELQVKAEEHHYTYHHEWMGVPIIRLPDDIVLQQEIVHYLRPSTIIETGIARGGSLALSASLMEINSIAPSVLGLDLLIMPHAKSAIRDCKFANSITLWEGDSSSSQALEVAKSFVSRKSPQGPILLILDSDHSENHVINELKNFCDLLPVGSVVMVADTIIEEFPKDHYKNRPWNVGNNPLTALRKFLQADSRFIPIEKWNRRSLLSEFRDGIIEKIRS
jgi:cephalosporin hydroxylase